MENKMKLEVKNVQSFQGSDFPGFTATLYINDKKSAVIHDGGYGGCMETIQVIDKTAFSKLESQFPPNRDEGFYDPQWNDFVYDLVGQYDVKKKHTGRKVVIKERGQFEHFDILEFKVKIGKERKMELEKWVSEKYPNHELVSFNPVVMYV